MTRGVFLDDESPASTLTTTLQRIRFWFSGLFEVPFRFVWLERISRRPSFWALRFKHTLYFSRKSLHLLEDWFKKVAELFHSIQSFCRCKKQSVSIFAPQRCI